MTGDYELLARYRHVSIEEALETYPMSQKIILEMMYSNTMFPPEPVKNWRRIKRELRKIGLVRKGIRRP